MDFLWKPFRVHANSAATCLEFTQPCWKHDFMGIPPAWHATFFLIQSLCVFVDVCLFVLLCAFCLHHDVNTSHLTCEHTLTAHAVSTTIISMMLSIRSISSGDERYLGNYLEDVGNWFGWFAINSNICSVVVWNSFGTILEILNTSSQLVRSSCTPCWKCSSRTHQHSFVTDSELILTFTPKREITAFEHLKSEAPWFAHPLSVWLSL